MYTRGRATGRTAPTGETHRPGTRGRHWRQWQSAAGFALLSTLLVVGRSAAQDVQGMRLTVLPREMATGTRTERAGTFEMPGRGVLYVPPKCVGTRRCPLWVQDPDATRDSVVRYLQRGVDEFGLLLLVMPLAGQTAAIDSALKQVLARFAVDPAKIALGGDAQIVFTNPDVFNRSVIYYGTPHITNHRIDPQGPREIEFFEDAGATHDYHFALTTLAEMADLRAQGYPTKQVLGLRSHGFDDYHGYGPQATFYFAARWLNESWSIPDPAARSRPMVVADPLPLLTPEALAQMIAFWGSFQQEPDSVRGEERQRHLREVLVPVGLKEAPPSAVMVDMAALAAEAPSVAAKLKAAGLTAQQHDAYRVALWGAIFLAAAQNPVIYARRHPSMAVDDHSIMGQNVAFVLAHPDELLALEQTAIWMTP